VRKAAVNVCTGVLELGVITRQLIRNTRNLRRKVPGERDQLARRQSIGGIFGELILENNNLLRDNN